MMAQLEITPPRHDGRSMPVESSHSLSLVAVASEPVQEGSHRGQSRPAAAVSFRLRTSRSESRRVRYTRVTARTVGGSAAWLLRRTGKTIVRNPLAGAIVTAPGGVPDLPQNRSGILGLLHREEDTGLDHTALAAAIVALRGADAVIAGPLSPDDAAAPGLLPHLADLTSRAYRALRPPSELIAHPGFGQVARRFHFIQMSHQDARWLAAGAIDIGVLAQSLRRIRGDQGEFAITAFCGQGVLWAENRFWEIDPIGDRVDEAQAGAAFCAAWVVARRFLGKSAAKALAYARSTAMRTVSESRKETRPCERTGL